MSVSARSISQIRARIDTHDGQPEALLRDRELNSMLVPLRSSPTIPIRCTRRGCHRVVRWVALSPGRPLVALGRERKPPKERRGGSLDLVVSDRGHLAQGFTPTAAEATADGVNADPGYSPDAVTRWSLDCPRCRAIYSVTNATLLAAYVSALLYARPEITLT